MIPRINEQNVIAENMANASTTGYKKTKLYQREVITWENALSHALGDDRNEVPEETRIDYLQGSFEETNGRFDMALNGSGFLRVMDNQGNIFFTRNGRFHRDNRGFLMNNDGMLLLNERFQPINSFGKDFVINTDGSIRIDGTVTDKIGIAEFAAVDYPNLRPIGKELFQKPPTVFEIAPSINTEFIQGYLEDSNVDPIREMVNMITAHRRFESGQKAIQMQDATVGRAVNDVGVVR
jgi:flagellar basal-body rod protein FlgG